MTCMPTLATPRHRPAYRWLLLAVFSIVLVALAGCAQTGDMAVQPRLNPLSASELFANNQSARLPVEGSVPYAAGDTSANAPADTGLGEDGQAVKGWPVKVDKDLVQLGQERFNIYCVPCHGATGTGNGKATQFGFPKPPDLMAATNLSNGEIFAIIKNGRGIMFPYGYRVKPNERWAIIAYIRALQQKKGAVDPQTLTPDQLNQIGSQQ